MWYVYMAKYEEKLYTGMTDGVERQFKEYKRRGRKLLRHFSGKGGIINRYIFNTYLLQSHQEVHIYLK